MRSYHFVICLIVVVCDSKCKWKDITLEPLSALNIQCDQNERYDFLYAPCSDTLKCEGGQDNNEVGMVLHWNSEQNNCDLVIAKWDETVEPYYDNRYSTDAYSFYYRNAPTDNSCPNGKSLNLTFICQEDADPYDEDTMSCTRGSGPDQGVCYYRFQIQTMYACQSHKPHHENQLEVDGLSVGSIMIIIILTLFMIYCLMGYIVNAFKSKDWFAGRDNLPQYQFWKNVPVWTMIGCKVSYDALRNKKIPIISRVEYNKL